MTHARSNSADVSPAPRNGLRILLLTSVLPWPLRRNGGSQRTALVRDALARHGVVDTLAIGGAMLVEPAADLDEKLAAQNVVGCFVRDDKPTYRAPWYAPGPLANVGATVAKYEHVYTAFAPAHQRFMQLVAQNKYDVIVSRYLQPAIQCGAVTPGGTRAFQHIPLVLDFDDIDWLTLGADIRSRPWRGVTGPLAARRVLKRVTDIGTRALQAFDHAWVTSDEDRAALASTNVATSVLPNIAFSDDPAGWIKTIAPNEDTREVLFVGDLQLPPNRDGLDRFVSRIWPGVCARVPGALLTIVGRGLTEQRKAQWSSTPGTNVLGFAPSLIECYQRSAFTIAPLWFGGGTKIKVLETLAFGRTAVVTPHALRGYAALRDAQPPCVAIADDDVAFVNACVTLLSDAPARSAMALRGRAMVEQLFSPARFHETVDATMRQLLKTARKETV